MMFNNIFTQSFSVLSVKKSYLLSLAEFKTRANKDSRHNNCTASIFHVRKDSLPTLKGSVLVV